MNFLLSCLGQVIPFLPLAYAISISFNILQVTDLALDASFVVGAGVSAKLITLGYNPFYAMFIALIAGAVAGVLTSLIQHKSRINSLLASILSAFILFSIILIIMDRPNISMLDGNNILAILPTQNFAGQHDLILLSIYSILGCSLAYFIISFSRFGVLMTAMGCNQNLLRRLGYKTELLRSAGFALTNLLAALSGVLTSTSVGYADVNMSIGLTLTGIGTVIIGQSIIKNFCSCYKFRLILQLIACAFGVSLYFLIINMLLQYGLNPVYIKMLVGILLVMFLYLSSAIKRDA